MCKLIFIVFVIIFYVNIVTSRHHHQSWWTPMEDKCTNATGDPEYFSKNTLKIVKSVSCYFNILDNPRLDINLELIPSDGLNDIIELFKEKCPLMINITQECYDDSVNYLKNCLNSDEIIATNKFRKIMNRLVQFLCNDNGNIAAHALIQSGNLLLPEKECYRKFNDVVSSCLDPIVRKYNFLHLPSEFIMGDNCKDLNRVKSCINPMVTGCNKIIAFELFVGLINDVMDELSCGSMEDELNNSNTNINNNNV